MKLVEEKKRLREKIWSLMERKKIARFPFPLKGRIPNFVGAETAARRFAELSEFKKARVIKVNPDSPQRAVREAVLKAGKVLYVPTPRLKGGFLQLDPVKLKGKERQASFKGGFLRYGKPVKLTEMEKVNLVVAGCVAADRAGAKVGKHGGYSDIEAATLYDLGLIGKTTPVATTVHDAQLVSKVPFTPHDCPVDIIVTPTQVIRTKTKYKKPHIIWGLVKPRMAEIPLLIELQNILKKRGKL